MIKLRVCTESLLVIQVYVLKLGQLSVTITTQVTKFPNAHPSHLHSSGDSDMVPIVSMCYLSSCDSCKGDGWTLLSESYPVTVDCLYLCRHPVTLGIVTRFYYMPISY